MAFSFADPLHIQDNTICATSSRVDLQPRSTCSPKIPPPTTCAYTSWIYNIHMCVQPWSPSQYSGEKIKQKWSVFLPKLRAERGSRRGSSIRILTAPCTHAYRVCSPLPSLKSLKTKYGGRWWGMMKVISKKFRLNSWVRETCSSLFGVNKPLSRQGSAKWTRNILKLKRNTSCLCRHGSRENIGISHSRAKSNLNTMYCSW